MICKRLYISFEIHPDFASQLLKIPKPKYEVYIQNNDNSLIRHSTNGKEYLSKLVEAPISLNQLDLIKNHMYSVLKNLVPEYGYEKHPLNILVHDSISA